MISPDRSHATWRKSSYSTTESNCVEVAAWRKSSYSTNDSNCVEVALAPALVGIRDTKDRDGGTLVLPASAWTAFRTTQL